MSLPLSPVLGARRLPTYVGTQVGTATAAAAGLGCNDQAGALAQPPYDWTTTASCTSIPTLQYYDLSHSNLDDESAEKKYV